jgi:alpha-tubulin suppressor-like RCC1 family protein
VSGGHVFTTIATASNHACALTSAGGLYCWGANAKGQLGDGTMTASSTPRLVPEFTFFMVSTGGNSTCGVTTLGFAYCWGDNRSGQLGNGSTANSAIPVKVAGQT